MKLPDCFFCRSCEENLCRDDSYKSRLQSPVAWACEKSQTISGCKWQIRYPVMVLKLCIQQKTWKSYHLDSLTGGIPLTIMLRDVLFLPVLVCDIGST